MIYSLKNVWLFPQLRPFYEGMIRFKNDSVRSGRQILGHPFHLPKLEQLEEIVEFLFWQFFVCWVYNFFHWRCIGGTVDLLLNVFWAICSSDQWLVLRLGWCDAFPLFYFNLERPLLEMMVLDVLVIGQQVWIIANEELATFE